MARGKYITKAMEDVLTDVIARVRGLRIEGTAVKAFTNTPAGIVARIDADLVRRSAGGDNSFPAIITGNALMTGHTARWWYAWAEVMGWTSILPSSGAAGTYVTTGGRYGTAIPAPSGSDLGGAFNVWEYTHVANPGGTTAWYPGGIQANSSNTTTSYPSTFGVRPVGGGGNATTHRLSVLVRMYPFDFASVTRYGYFGPAVTHDGACP